MEQRHLHFFEHDAVILVDRRGREYMTRLREGQVLDIRGGKIEHAMVIGTMRGTQLSSTTGEQFLLFSPTLAQFVMHMRRTRQIVYPKDLAVLLIWADVFPGARVVEAGTGSGALAMALMRAVTEQGRVYSYEVRESVLRCAQKNITGFLGPHTAMQLRAKDVYEGIEEVDIDQVILDVPQPWRVIVSAARALRAGGIFASYVPTIMQARRLVDSLQHADDFCCEETIETLVRPWNIDGMSVRPVHRMVAHTGFIVTARHYVRFASHGSTGR